ncbi:Endonuclease/Exonuclease/phosphatase [Pleurostoma richardsiae]|uniref:Endonuclease/Exonuclease/phosphatase n=1 Tax=Pleurostoma richardsiae TaxID=41990 RepID=A0AA38RMV1_9PEZI|nr:Endonuclease/Exonuclease/phosphatase [Pleurostoma richardsiae]
MGTSTDTPPLPLRIITFNIRYATTSPFPGEQPWAVRCPRICAQLRFATTGRDASFICLQEALHRQLLDVHERLGPGWARIGVGRDDGLEAGEFSPVFYRADAWECERARTYWLSPTPEVPSRGWDAVLNRVVTVGRFRHRASGAPVVVMSTHFDHVGVVAREESAKLILRIAAAWAEGDDAAGASPRPAVFLGGDFNSKPEDAGYRTMTAPGSGMTDVMTRIPEERRYGNAMTYTSFDEPGKRPTRIDFLFARQANEVQFINFGALCNRFEDGVYLSDHRAVVADVEVPVRGIAPL